MSNPLARLRCVGDVDLRKFKKLNSRLQEQHLQEMYAVIVDVASSKLEKAEPFRKELKDMLAECEKKKLDDSSPFEIYPLIYGIRNFMSIELEFFAKCANRWIKWTETRIASPDDDPGSREANFQIASCYIETLGVSGMDGKEFMILYRGHRFVHPEKAHTSPEELKKMLSEGVGVNQQMIDFLDCSSRCASTALIEHDEADGHLFCLYSDIALYRTCPLSPEEAAELDRIEKVYESMRSANTNQIKFLNELRDYNTNLYEKSKKRMGMTPLEDRKAVAARKCGQGMKRCLEAYCAREKIVDKLWEMSAKIRKAMQDEGRLRG